MPLPTERTVTGKYINPVTGEPYNGTDGDHYVVFEPVPERWTDQGGNQILLGGGRVNLEADGSFSENVVCTDAPDVLPEESRLWRLRQFVGGSWTTSLIAVPVGDGSALDITDLLSVEVDGITYVPVEGPVGPAGSTGPQGEPGLDGGLDTGIVLGGSISPNATNPLAIDISPLSGRFVDYSVNPPVVTEIEVTETITVELDSIAQTRAVTWFLMGQDQLVFQQEAQPSPEERRNFLVLGPVIQDGGEIVIAQSLPTVIEQPVNQLYDLMDAIGPFNMSGNVVTANGSNLMLDQSAGKVFSRGWNHIDGDMKTDNPHVVTTIGAAPASWIHMLRTSELVLSTATPVVDVANYDSDGVLTPVTGTADSAVVHQLWMFPTAEGSEIRALQYGQQVYDSLAEAVQAAPLAPMSVNPALSGSAILVAHLAVKATATDLSDPTQAELIPVYRFGGGAKRAEMGGYARLTGAEFAGPVGARTDAPDGIVQYSRVDGEVQDRFRRLADGRLLWGDGAAIPDAELRRLSPGVLALLATDLLIGQESAKAYRLKQSGEYLDLDGAGADLLLSIFELANFAGTQRTYLRLEAGVQLAHAIGKWIFSDGIFGGAVHTLDGTANQLGFHGAEAVGQQAVTGERSTGAALQSLLQALNLVGLVSDTTTAGPAVVETVNDETGPNVVLSAADVDAIAVTEKGAVNGVATLGPTGKVTEGQLLGASEIVVAASNSRANQRADFTCTGTNDHLVIQQAINLVNAAPGKGTVRLLDGTFSLGATLSIPNGVGLGLVGSGWGTVLKNADATGIYAITFAGPGETRARFTDFTIDGNLANQTAGGGIWAPGAVESVFQNLHLTACYDTGLYLGPQADTAFGHNNYVSQCLFDNAMDSPGAGRGIHTQSSDENFITACDFQFLGGATAQGAGIYDQAGTQLIVSCNFVNGGNSMPAIRVQDAQATKVFGCNFDGVGGDAVFLAASNCLVSGNTIFGIGAVGTAGAYSGIHLEWAATGNLISGNSIASAEAAGAARSLIREESIGDSGSNSFIGNVLITKGALAVGALDLNAPNSLVRANMGGGIEGDPAPAARTVAGAVSDASFPAARPPADGTLAIDTVNLRLYARVGGAWHYTALT